MVCWTLFTKNILWQSKEMRQRYYLNFANKTDRDADNQYNRDAGYQKESYCSDWKVAEVVKNAGHPRIRLCCHHFGQRISDLVVSGNHNILSSACNKINHLEYVRPRKLNEKRSLRSLKICGNKQKCLPLTFPNEDIFFKPFRGQSRISSKESWELGLL